MRPEGEERGRREEAEGPVRRLPGRDLRPDPREAKEPRDEVMDALESEASESLPRPKEEPRLL